MGKPHPSGGQGRQRTFAGPRRAEKYHFHASHSPILLNFIASPERILFGRFFQSSVCCRFENLSPKALIRTPTKAGSYYT